MSEELIWELGSTSGWAEVLCYNAEIEPFDPGKQCVTVRLIFTAKYWDRRIAFRVDDDHPLAEDLILSLPQVVLPIAGLRSLEQALANWMRDLNPVSEMALCSGEQQLTLSLNVSDELISSREKPVCTFRYRARMHDDMFRFGTDETCIWRMHLGLEEWLKERKRKTEVGQ